MDVMTTSAEPNHTVGLKKRGKPLRATVEPGRPCITKLRILFCFMHMPFAVICTC